MGVDRNQFGFGIETEHCLVNTQTFQALFCDDLNFERLRDLVDAIDVSDFHTEGFNIKPLHCKANPYLIEGYYLTDDQMKPTKMLPKGVEVRTPIAHSIDETISSLAIATERLRQKMSTQGWSMCSISHHPTKSNFQAPPNYKRHDYWQWALTAMTTFGPDINISVPVSLEEEVQQHVLNERINYYLPPVVALTFNSPLFDGGLWEVNGKTGKSVRTHKRSLWAPLYYVHTDPALRFEFKGFEMATDIEDYKAMFLLGLALLMDNTLTGRSSDRLRLERLQSLAINGLSSESEKDRAAALLSSAERIASRFNMDPSSLKTLRDRLNNGFTPADAVIKRFTETGSINETLKGLSVAPLQSGSAFKVPMPLPV